jgi:hypothetical protein
MARIAETEIERLKAEVSLVRLYGSLNLLGGWFWG